MFVQFGIAWSRDAKSAQLLLPKLRTHHEDRMKMPDHRRSDNAHMSCARAKKTARTSVHAVRDVSRVTARDAAEAR
jgi:hypothetical protein